MKARHLEVTNVWTGETQGNFKSWDDMLLYMENWGGDDASLEDLLPACNGWNLDYWGKGESFEEYKARLIDMAIGLDLL